MAYTNVIYDHVIDGMYDIIATEFPGTQIRFDKNVNNSFLIIPQSDEIIEYVSSGQTRNYIIQIVYEHKVVAYSKSTFKELTNIIERVKELFKNNSNETSTYYKDMILTEDWEAVNKNWEDAVDLWGGQFQRWINGRIANVEYEHDGDVLRALLTFNCTVVEVT